MTTQPDISKTRLVIGAAIFVSGFLSPLLIPFITATDLSVGLKTTVSGLLAFGVPEIFMVVAVGVLGKQGYEFLKAKAMRYLKRFAPPDSVSLGRYRFGLILFVLPLVFGFLQPYMGHLLPLLNDLPLGYTILGDTIFLSSLFVLGGDFWDKLSGLFRYGSKISK